MPIKRNERKNVVLEAIYEAISSSDVNLEEFRLAGDPPPAKRRGRGSKLDATKVFCDALDQLLQLGVRTHEDTKFKDLIIGTRLKFSPHNIPLCFVAAMMDRECMFNVFLVQFGEDIHDLVGNTGGNILHYLCGRDSLASTKMLDTVFKLLEGKCTPAAILTMMNVQDTFNKNVMDHAGDRDGENTRVFQDYIMAKLQHYGTQVAPALDFADAFLQAAAAMQAQIETAQAAAVMQAQIEAAQAAAVMQAQIEAAQADAAMQAQIEAAQADAAMQAQIEAAKVQAATVPAPTIVNQAQMAAFEAEAAAAQAQQEVEKAKAAVLKAQQDAEQAMARLQHLRKVAQARATVAQARATAEQVQTALMQAEAELVLVLADEVVVVQPSSQVSAGTNGFFSTASSSASATGAHEPGPSAKV